MSIKLAEAEAKAAEFSGKLTAYDFDPRQSVRIVDEGGYDCTSPSAFVVSYGEWVMVFAEHHKPVIHHEDEVECIEVYTVDYTDKPLPEIDKYKLKKPKSTKRKGKKSE